MIPNDVRKAIVQLLHLAKFEGRCMDDAATIAKWLDAQPQAPYSHRNGETEPPTVEGYYWFMGAPKNEIVYAVFDGTETRATCTGDAESFVVHDDDGPWYGPIPEPEGS